MKFLLKVLVLMGQLLVVLYSYYLVFSYSSFYCLLIPIITYAQICKNPKFYRLRQSGLRVT